MEEGCGKGDEALEQATMPSSSSPPKQPVGGWKAVRYILGNETFEKLASMSLVANLVLYLHTRYNMDNVASSDVYNIWSGSSNFAPLIGAYLADTYLGKYSTLLYSSIASLLGIVLLTLTASLHELTPAACNGIVHCEHANAWQKLVLYSGLGLIVIGAGGLRPCNIAFGADQFDTTTEKGRAQLDSFCSWWYLLFSIALIIALTAVVYIQTNISWVLGFAIPAGCFGFSILIFLLGRKLYIRVKPQGSTFGGIVRVIVAAFRKFRTKTSGQSLYEFPLTGGDTSEEILAHTERFKFLDKAAVIVDPNEVDTNGNPVSGWRLCSVQQDEQLKAVVGLLPVCVSGIGCFIAMQQMPSFGTFQAIQPNKKIGKFEIPPAWMGLTPMVSLSIWIIIYESIYIRLIQKRNSHENSHETGRLTMETRFRVGIVMSILCMVVAGLTEMKRRNSALENKSFESPTTVALLVPQFALSGLIEAFGAITLMELLTTQSPKSLRTLAGAFFFVNLSIGSYSTTVLVNIVKKVTSLNGNTSWLGGNDLNKNRLDYYYYTVAGLGVLNLLYFQFIARHFLADAVGHARTRSSRDEERQ